MVILGTPIVTNIFRKVNSTKKLIIGEILIGLGLGAYIFIQGLIPLYYVSMVLFTLGEVFSTLGQQPYLTRRIPASHRGRISGMASVFKMFFDGLCIYYMSRIVEVKPFVTAWKYVAVFSLITVASMAVLNFADKKSFPLLYTD